MAAGFAVTKETAADLFARRFHDAGFSVLAFDYRGIGESGGQPRQVRRIRDQVADWQAAITFAAALPEVDPVRLAAWSFRPPAARSSKWRHATSGWPRLSRGRPPTTR